MITTTKLCELFEVSRETVRKWSLEFAAYLSPGANPGLDRTRQYSDDDLRVFALIADMKRRGMLYSDVHAALKIGQRGDVPHETQALATHERGRLNLLHKRVSDLEQALTDALQEKERMAGQIDLLTRQLETAQKQIEALNRQIGRMEK